MDVSNLSEQELTDLSKKIKDREYEMTQKSFDDFYETDDFKWLCQINSCRMQEQNVEITVTVRALVSVSSFKDETRTDIIASDKGDLIARANMIDALNQKPAVQKMQTSALKAEALFDIKMHEFVDKHKLDRALAWMKITNEMGRRKKWGKI